MPNKTLYLLMTIEMRFYEGKGTKYRSQGSDSVLVGHKGI